MAVKIKLLPSDEYHFVYGDYYGSILRRSDGKYLYYIEYDFRTISDPYWKDPKNTISECKSEIEKIIEKHEREIMLSMHLIPFLDLIGKVK